MSAIYEIDRAMCGSEFSGNLSRVVDVLNGMGYRCVAVTAAYNGAENSRYSGKEISTEDFATALREAEKRAIQFWVNPEVAAEIVAALDERAESGEVSSFLVPHLKSISSLIYDEFDRSLPLLARERGM